MPVQQVNDGQFAIADSSAPNPTNVVMTPSSISPPILFIDNRDGTATMTINLTFTPDILGTSPPTILPDDNNSYSVFSFDDSQVYNAGQFIVQINLSGQTTLLSISTSPPAGINTNAKKGKYGS